MTDVERILEAVVAISSDVVPPAAPIAMARLLGWTARLQSQPPDPP